VSAELDAALLEKGKVSEIARLLQIDAKLAAKKIGFERPLTIATKAQRPDVCALLLDHGAQLTHADGHGWTAMQLACQARNCELVRLFVQRGADVRKRGPTGQTPLESVLFVRNETCTEIMRELIRAGESALSRFDGGNTLLHMCVMMDRPHDYAKVRVALKFAAFLLDEAPDLLETKNKSGKTPLMACFPQPCREALDFLLTKGADVRSRDNYGRTLITNLLIYGPADVAWRMVPQLAHQGVDVAARFVHDDQKVTALHVDPCCDARVFRHLIDAGADIEAETSMQETPLATTLRIKSIVPFRVLLAAGANVDVSVSDRYAPTKRPIMTSYNLDRNHARLLLAAGAAIPRDHFYLPTPITADDVESARREIHTERMAWLRARGRQILIGLQNAHLPALLSTMILDEAVAPAIFLPLHVKWNLVVCVKHFRDVT
jgi:ankyrin repeat protein